MSNKLLRQAIIESAKHDNNYFEINIDDVSVDNPPSAPGTPRTRMRKHIKNERGIKMYKWPPTLDLSLYKKMLNHKTWWHGRRELVPMIGLLLGIILFVVVKLATRSQDNENLEWTAATTVLMATWWLTEAVPLPVTALLPVIVFPITGVMSSSDTAAFYMNSTEFLLIGGFILALTMEKWNLHRRIALKMVILFGIQPYRLMLGMMTATFLSSTMVSNVAAVMMMMPNAMQIIKDMEEYLPPATLRKFSVGILLGLAYSSSIGGTATLVGSPPNLVFVKLMSITFPDAPEVTFAKWLIFALPMSLALFVVTYAYLWWRYCPKTFLEADDSKFKTAYAALGPMRAEEILVLAGVVLTVFLWLFRADLDFGAFVIPGWARLFGSPSFLDDGTVAIFIAMLFFILPARPNSNKPEAKKKELRAAEEEEANKLRWSSRLLGWDTASGLPWDVILLLGGGFALAAAFQSSGLAASIGSFLSSFRGLPTWVTVILVSLVIHGLTEFTSNTATTQVTLPIVASLAVSIGVNPFLLLLPGVMSASLAFMMHIATAPNLVVFSTHKINLTDMITTGFLLDVISVLVTTVFTFLLAPPVFGASLHEFPSWAQIHE